MKKLLFLGAITLVLGATSSCNKEYECTCIDAATLTESTKTGKGKTAEEACTDAADKVLGVPVEACTPK